MEKANVQTLMDRLAISASVLCMLHCVATPLLLIAAPVISSTFLADEAFHQALVMFVLPTSLLALFLGCKNHRDNQVLVLGGLGLTTLVAVAFFGHDLLGEIGEKVATVISGAMLAFAHLRNYRLCKQSHCQH